MSKNQELKERQEDGIRDRTVRLSHLGVKLNGINCESHKYMCQKLNDIMKRNNLMGQYSCFSSVLVTSKFIEAIRQSR